MLQAFSGAQWCGRLQVGSALIFVMASVVGGFDKAMAAPSVIRAESTPLPVRPDFYDNQRKMDITDLDLCTSNFGTIANEPFWFGPGTRYPRGSETAVIFAAGFWMGAMAQGTTRVAVSEYIDESDWTPGRIVNGTPEDGSPVQHQSYKMISANSKSYSNFAEDTLHVIPGPGPRDLFHQAWDYYREYARGYLGAPLRTRRMPVTTTPDPSDSVDVSGPDLPGDVAIWSVYNDAVVAAHRFRAGSTAPLGVEVRETVFAKPDGPAIYFRWQIYNRGSNHLENAHVGLWCDADVGNSTDDLVGFDRSRDLGFVYNALANDLDFGARPPAVGVLLIQGPLDPGTGKRRGVAAFNRYLNGQDPIGGQQSYYLMQGLTSGAGPIVDPTTNQVTTIQFTGDPVTGSGWIDTTPGDQRTLFTTGPLTMAPGDSTTLVVAIVAQQGTDRLDSIAKLRCAADAARRLYADGFPAGDTELACDGAVPAVMFFEESSVTTEGAVRLVWTAGDRQGGPYALERTRNEATEWARLALVSPDGVGRIICEDADVSPGDRLAYRLVDPNSGAALPGGDAHVVVPIGNDAGAELALAVLPPDGDGVLARFTLAVAGQVRLAMYDVLGHRVAELDLGHFEAGTYVKRVGGGAERRSGLYFVRLEFAGERRVAKALVLHR